MKNASNVPGKLWKQLWKRAAKKLLPKKTGKILDFLSKPAIIGAVQERGCVPMGIVSRSKVHIVRDRALVSGGSLPSALSAAL